LSGDQTKFTRAAHSIKGSSSNLGAMALRAAAEKLEHRVRIDGLANVGELLADLKAEFGRAQAALTSLLGQ
jgi:HPt (histidine-containing phosphotransfer) domain-containing protein